jgi:putative PIN family toxin of toxin-antitoxin system
LLRIVVDSNVLVSAVISTGGPPAEVLDRWRNADFDLVVSAALLAEVEKVLLRPKFRAWVAEADAHAYVRAVALESVVVDDPPAVAGITPDPADDYLVALAREARADVIVSGDAHLTKLEIDPPVLTPREFLDRLGPP